MGRFRRALHLCASLVVCLTLALLASRWQATRALDAARGRTEALGLRLDTDTRELPRAPVVEAAIAEAWRVCRAIDDATGQRYDAEHGSSVYDEAAYDALLREEAGRASEELMVAVERYLAVGAAPRRLALPYGGVRLVPEGADEAPDDEGVLVLYLVQHLCRAASVDVEAGYGAGAWRQLEAAAEVCMTLRDTDLHSFSLLGGGLRRLKSSFEEAVAADASDPARARIRATLGELDVAHMALMALRATGAANLHAAETRPELARVHSAVQRAMGHHWRDRAELHQGWADIVEVSERAPPGERGAALKAICARPWAAAGHHTVSARLLPDASILWQYVAANEADLAVLLAE
jgi:hypothetical protein